MGNNITRSTGHVATSRPVADNIEANTDQHVAPAAQTPATKPTPSAQPQPTADGMDRDAPARRQPDAAAANTPTGGTGVLPFQVADLLPVDGKGAGPKGPARPEVASMLATYGKGRLGRPAERLTRWGALVHNLITEAAGGGVSKVVDVMISKDIRRQVFLLEGGLKFYKKAYPELEPLLVQSKALEDVLGHVKGGNTMLELAQETGAPKEVIAVLQHHVDDARGRLEALVEKEWMPDADGQLPAMTTMLNTFESMDWMTGKDDKKFVRKEFARRLKKMGAVPYKMEELQGDFGVHELRRNLRWIPIYAEALDGLVQHDASVNPVKAYEPLLEKDISSSKYMNLPEGDFEKKPIKVSKSLYAANMTLVGAFGDLKDRGEEVEELALAYKEAGLAPDYESAEQLVLDLLGLDKAEPTTLTDEAGKLYDELSANGLFKAMRKDYKG